MTITIYTIRDEDFYRVGAPAAHLLEEPASISSTWITCAEYELPDGYSVAERWDGILGIYDARGEYCPLGDNRYYGNGGGEPVLISNRVIPLVKVRDLW